MITWTVYGELPRDLVASNTEAGPAAPPPTAGSAPNPATPQRKKEYFIEASVELDGSSAGGGAASSVATAGLLPSGAGGKTFFKSNNREHIYPMGCRDLACTHGYEEFVHTYTVWPPPRSPCWGVLRSILISLPFQFFNCSASISAAYSVLLHTLHVCVCTGLRRTRLVSRLP